MKRQVLIATAAAAVFLSSTAVAQDAAVAVRYGALPVAIQRHIDQQASDCESTTDISSVSAYRVDINGDDHADFIFPPSSELTGTAGFCTSNWIPVILWTFDGNGSYSEIVLGSDNWFYQRDGHFLATSDCDDNLKLNGVGFAVLNRAGTEITGFGRSLQMERRWLPKQPASASDL